MTFQAIKKVCVIGGGPSGLAAVKSLNGEKVKFDIDLYERKSNLGGVWNYLPHKSKYKSDEDICKAQELNFSPMYQKLETNILFPSMEYSTLHFPEGTEQFPPRTEVLRYLLKFADSIGPFNKFLNREVLSVEKEDVWKVTTKDFKSGETATENYDAVVLANGHFDVPYFPEVDGLDQWREKDPSSVTHAKFYDSPDRFNNKTVLVIGAFSSGSDIAVQLTTNAKKVYVSTDNDDTILAKIDNPHIEVIPKIESYNIDDRSAHFYGKSVSGIDEIIFCTGYLYDIPFLKLDICRKKYVKDVYLQVFYIKDPTLTIVGLGKDVSPFPFAEAQSTIVARYFSGRLKLPSKEEMTEAFNKELAEKGDRFHSFKFPLEADYINGLYQIIENQDLLEGALFQKFIGERVERKKANPEVKLKRIIANNQLILESRNRSID